MTRDELTGWLISLADHVMRGDPIQEKRGEASEALREAAGLLRQYPATADGYPCRPGTHVFRPQQSGSGRICIGNVRYLEARITGPRLMEYAAARCYAKAENAVAAALTNGQEPSTDDRRSPEP